MRENANTPNSCFGLKRGLPKYVVDFGNLIDNLIEFDRFIK